MVGKERIWESQVEKLLGIDIDDKLNFFKSCFKHLHET